MNANQVIVYHNDPVVAVHVHILHRDLNEVLRPSHQVQAARVQLTLRPAQSPKLQLLCSPLKLNFCAVHKNSTSAQSIKIQLLRSPLKFNFCAVYKNSTSTQLLKFNFCAVHQNSTSAQQKFNFCATKIKFLHNSQKFNFCATIQIQLLLKITIISAIVSFNTDCQGFRDVFLHFLQ